MRQFRTTKYKLNCINANVPYKTILIVQNPTLSSQLTHWLATNLLQSTEFLWKQHLPSMISSSFRSRRTLRLCWVSRKISSHAIQAMHYWMCLFKTIFAGLCKHTKTQPSGSFTVRIVTSNTETPASGTSTLTTSIWRHSFDSFELSIIRWLWVIVEHNQTSITNVAGVR